MCPTLVSLIIRHLAHMVLGSRAQFGLDYGFSAMKMVECTRVLSYHYGVFSQHTMILPFAPSLPSALTRASIHLLQLLSLLRNTNVHLASTLLYRV